MDITIVGCGTVVPTPDRVCAGIHIRASGTRLLLDCGPGVVHNMARFGLRWDRLTHIAVSHFHTDHIGGLPLLFFALRHGVEEPRTEPLTVLGPHGIRERMRRLADAFGDFVLDPGFPVTVDALTADAPVRLGGGLTLRGHPSEHTDASFGYRVESDAGAFGYTGDTGYSESLAGFLRGVDVLVAECSLPDDAAVAGHLTPSSLAAMARAARPGRLIATHVYPQLEREALPDLVRAAGWTGRTAVAEDGLRIAIPGG